jgi:hypothetical protein
MRRPQLLPRPSSPRLGIPAVCLDKVVLLYYYTNTDALANALRIGDQRLARLGSGGTAMKKLFVSLAGLGLIVYLWLITAAV